MGDIFTDEELNILGPLVLGEKSRAEQAIFKQNPVDPEWQKYLDTLNALLTKLKDLKVAG